ECPTTDPTFGVLLTVWRDQPFTIATPGRHDGPLAAVLRVPDGGGGAPRAPVALEADSGGRSGLHGRPAATALDSGGRSGLDGRHTATGHASNVRMPRCVRCPAGPPRAMDGDGAAGRHGQAGDGSPPPACPRRPRTAGVAAWRNQRLLQRPESPAVAAWRNQRPLQRSERARLLRTRGGGQPTLGRPAARRSLTALAPPSVRPD